MEDKKANSLFLPVGAVVVLAAALGLGMGIRKVRSWRTELEPEQQVTQEDRQAETNTQEEKAVVKATEEEHAAVPEQVEETQAKAEEVVEEDSNEAPKPEAMEQSQTMMAGGMGNWRQMWADLNLTPEEMARLREGFRLAMERWQNMSEEERQAQMARFRAMRERWEGMSDEERQEAMQRMRGRFEDWRANGAVELPEMTLD